MSMCMYLTPKGFRGDRPGWFLCTLTGKEVPKHRLSNCVRGECPDYRERGEAEVAGDKGKRIEWDEPANMTVDGAPEDVTLRTWVRAQIADEVTMSTLAKRIGCSWSTLQNAVKQPVLSDRKEPSGSCAEETQPAPEPKQVMGTCWNCGDLFPADSMHPDGDTLECDDCYREAHEPASEPTPTPTPTLAPPAARCQRCEEPVDGRLIMSGVGTVCELCADAIRQEWEAEQYPAPEPEPEFTCDRVAVPIVADGVTRETALGSATIDACKAYLRYLGLGEAEVNVLPVFIAGYCARGAVK